MATVAQKMELPATSIKLPAARLDSTVSLEKVLCARRSIREFTAQPLELSQVSQLAWAAQGLTGPEAHRTAPSAGGLYALELYIIAGKVNGLLAGVYRYDLLSHELVSLLTADMRLELSRAALDQTSITQAAAIFAISAVYERISSKYGDRG
ncbi:MAG: SagB/ThcOx family dehydrogenase, partial [Deltaproteobacteria bacterium]|nr:SagB/ThcOx family dehydrogenase [Deltaproteobacteria bacterium]